MISLDSVSSRACSGSTCGSPITCSRSRIGGSPPSAELSLVKNLETEKDEQGGDAKTAMTLCACPPPSLVQLSTQSAVSPFWVRNEDMPSGRENGPEKSMSTRREALGALYFGTWTRCGGANAASAEAKEGAATPGCCEPSSSARCAVSVRDELTGSQGNDRSSK
eukprot:4404666-Pleurochrysis_carterae.AAC.1